MKKIMKKMLLSFHSYYNVVFLLLLTIIISTNAFTIVIETKTTTTNNKLFLQRRSRISSTLPLRASSSSSSSSTTATATTTVSSSGVLSRRNMIKYSSTSLVSTATAATLALTVATTTPTKVNAVGPIKINLIPISYNAVICPPDKPIPGEKAMVGMRGLCVTVKAKMDSKSPKDLDKVGVYGFVTDDNTGDSVLANNPDGGTDAGQFAMIESISPNDTTVSFEFIAAVPREKDISIYDNGIGPLQFNSLRIISYPGGQQFGAISPCEMNEFSEECELWESLNGPYEKADYMVKSNPRTKGY